MKPRLEYLRRLIWHHPPQRREFITWLVTLILLLAIIIFARTTATSNNSFLEYVIGLYGLDSIIFFVLFQERPKMRLAMLTFLFLLEVAAAGYYLLTLAKA